MVLLVSAISVFERTVDWSWTTGKMCASRNSVGSSCEMGGAGEIFNFIQFHRAHCGPSHHSIHVSYDPDMAFTLTITLDAARQIEWLIQRCAYYYYFLSLIVDCVRCVVSDRSRRLSLACHLQMLEPLVFLVNTAKLPTQHFSLGFAFPKMIIFDGIAIVRLLNSCSSNSHASQLGPMRVIQHTIRGHTDTMKYKKKREHDFV